MSTSPSKSTDRRPRYVLLVGGSRTLTEAVSASAMPAFANVIPLPFRPVASGARTLPRPDRHLRAVA